MYEDAVAPICGTCGVRKRERRREFETEKSGPLYRGKCKKCRRPHQTDGPGGRTYYRGHDWHDWSKCARCGFVPEHLIQLDVDHIDGDRTNNHRSNHQVLCANCHRLKSFHEQAGREVP
jgi:5-methylcytosine-specific restriction endonuclease McrA